MKVVSILGCVCYCGWSCDTRVAVVIAARWFGLLLVVVACGVLVAVVVV